MSDFGAAWTVTEGREGGQADNPADRGGATNRGISLRYLKSLGDEDRDGYLEGDLNHDGVVDVADIRSITDADAKQLAFRGFWTKMRCDEIHDQLVAVKIFDLAFNMGPGAAALVLQRACRANLCAVKEDGLLGPVTIRAANSIPPVALLPAIRSEAAAVYRLIVAKDPSQQVFERGWLDQRAYS